MPLTSGRGLPPLHADLISSAGRNSHPTSWAPFVVVGEGAK